MDIAGELNQAGACFHQSNFHRAEDILSSILREDPENTDALNMLGSVFATQGSYDKAIHFLGRAAQMSPHDSRLHFNLGRCHQMKQDIPSARQAFEAAVSTDADNLPAWTMLNRIYQTADESIECIEACNHILRLVDRNAEESPIRIDAYIGIGTSELKRKNFHEAIIALDAADQENPGDARVYSRLGDVYRGQDNNGLAVENYLKAAELRPDSIIDRMNAGIACLRDGNHAQAQDLLQKCLSSEPGNRRVLSVYGPLLWEMVRDSDYHQLFDYENLIAAIDIDTPLHLYSSLRDFHRKLIQGIRDHPSLTGDRVSKATTGGFQTGNIFANPAPEVRDLGKMINARISSYISDPQHCPGTPGTEWAAAWNLIGWGVILSSQGYQTAHNHPSGMVSGVYYLQVPAEVNDDGEFPGCIEFGPPNDMYNTKREPPRHRVLAQDGRMCLFPSHYWHRTIPFESSEERICIAFDAIPRK